MKKYILFILFCSFNIFCQNVVVSINSLSNILSNILKNPKISYQTKSSPHDFLLSNKKVMQLLNIDYYVCIGVFAFEKRSIDFIRKNNKKAIILKLSDYVTLHNNNPHIWFSLQNLRKFLPVLQASFQNYVAEDKYQKYIKKIDKIVDKYKVLLNPYKGKTVVVYHSALYYLLKPFLIKEKAMSIQEGVQPSIKKIKQITKIIKDENINVIFVEEDFSKKLAKDLAKNLNIKTTTINLFEDDLLKQLDIFLEKIYESFKKS